MARPFFLSPASRYRIRDAELLQHDLILHQETDGRHQVIGVVKAGWLRR